jgi:uncharacterized membrane protein
MSLFGIERIAASGRTSSYTRRNYRTSLRAVARKGLSIKERARALFRAGQEN